MLNLSQDATYVNETEQEQNIEVVKTFSEDVNTTNTEVTLDGSKEEITDQQIAAWKAAWGKVFKTTVNGEEYIWRKLRRDEYVAAMGLEVETGENAKNNIYHRQEMIMGMITLYPSNVSVRMKEDAGLATAIADAAIAVAGFNVSETTEL